MPSIKNLSVQYHQQDTSYYCGAACAQMVLQEIGAGILDQVGLYNDNHSHGVADTGVNWATPPDGLQWTLINRKPSTFANTFSLFALDNEDAISRKIVWTIFHYEVAPIALVFGWAHWIVIRGYDVSADPANSADTSYSINGFDVNNPWPPTPAAASEPPHSAGDGCGTGGDRGIANEHIAYSTWQSDYMTGVPGGYWTGKFIAVCDPELPSQIIGKSQRPRSPFSGEKIIGKEEAVMCAKEGINQHNLLKKEGWNKRIKQSRAGEPVLVQRLDRLDSYYYIIPYDVGANKTGSLISVDARYGDYKQGAILPEPRPHLINAYEKGRKSIINDVLKKRFTLKEQLGKLIIRPEAFCLYPTLVWKPCRESLSPFWPFYMFTIGSQHIYVRIDGEIFTHLTDTGKGL